MKIINQNDVLESGEPSSLSGSFNIIHKSKIIVPCEKSRSETVKFEDTSEILHVLPRTCSSDSVFLNPPSTNAFSRDQKIWDRESQLVSRQSLSTTIATDLHKLDKIQSTLSYKEESTSCNLDSNFVNSTSRTESITRNSFSTFSK